MCARETERKRKKPIISTTKIFQFPNCCATHTITQYFVLFLFIYFPFINFNYTHSDRLRFLVSVVAVFFGNTFDSIWNYIKKNHRVFRVNRVFRWIGVCIVQTLCTVPRINWILLNFQAFSLTKTIFPFARVLFDPIQRFLLLLPFSLHIFNQLCFSAICSPFYRFDSTSSKTSANYTLGPKYIFFSFNQPIVLCIRSEKKSFRHTFKISADTHTLILLSICASHTYTTQYRGIEHKNVSIKLIFLSFSMQRELATLVSSISFTLFNRKRAVEDHWRYDRQTTRKKLKQSKQVKSSSNKKWIWCWSAVSFPRFFRRRRLNIS